MGHMQPTHGAHKSSPLLMVKKIPDEIRGVLDENLRRLIDHHEKLRQHRKIRGNAKIGGGTIEGITKGIRSTTIDNVAKVARAFGLEPWQFLVPDLDPENLPRLSSKKDDEIFYSRVQQQIHALQEEIAKYEVQKK